MGYRFLDDYDPRKEQKKKQQKNGALSAPRSGNALLPLAQNSKNKTTTPAAAARTSKGTALGGSSVTPVQLPQRQLTVPKLTKASVPMQKTTTAQAPKQLKLPTIQAFGAGDYSRAGKAMERIAKTVQAGAAQTASGFAEIAGQFRPTTGQQSMGQFSGFGDLGRAVRENREKGTDINTSIRQQEQQRRAQQKQSQQKIFDAATRLTEKGQQYEQEAKQGLGTVGQFLVDMGVTGTQMAGDALANLILPGSGLAMMGMRSYGQAAGEARREGKSEGQQFLAGLKSAGIEVFTEKMFGAFSKIYGGAAADDMVEKLVGKLTENATGQALLTWIINAVGEGVEEVTSDLLNPLADRLLRLDDGTGPIWSADDLAQWGYDFLLGTAMGMFGGGQQLARGIQQGQAQTAENNYYADLRRNGLGSANSAAHAQRAIDAMGNVMPARDGLRMPTLVDEQGRTYEQRQAAEYRGEKPQNVSDPRIGRLELSSEKYNPSGADISTVYGNRYRQQVKEDAIRRLGIADGKPAYLVAPNITKNGQEYYVDVTKASLNKMLYTREHEMLPLERILLVDNLEKAIDNSYWAESNGDRKSRPQIDGFDTLRTSFYVDGIPYYADIKVKVVQGKNGADPQNVVYFLEPEEITSIKRVDAPSPTGALLERNIVFRDGTSTVETSVPQSGTGVNMQGMQNGGEYAAAPAAPLQMPRLTDAQGRTYEERQAAERNNASAAQEYGLTEDEESAIVSYKSGDSYSLNGKLRSGEKLTGHQAWLRDNIDTALEKLPAYNDTVYRHYCFDDFGGYEAMREFLLGFREGEGIDSKSYWSASTVPNSDRSGGDYTVDMVIQSSSGRSLDGFGANAENEVLIPRKTTLIPVSMEAIGPHKVRITMREVAKNAAGTTADLLETGVRGLREGPQGYPNVRDIPGRNTGNIPTEISGAEGSGGQHPGLSGLRAREGSDTMGETSVVRPDRTGDGAETGINGLQMPQLTDEQGRTYEERQAEQRAERVTNLVDNIDALREAVDNGLRSPQLTTYEERTRAKAEAEKASVRDRVRQMDAMTDSSDYMDALARDENMFTSDAYTLADRLYDLQLRRAQQQEAPPERPAEQVAQENLDEIAELFTDQGSVFGSREDRIRDTENMVSDHTISAEKSGREKASEAWSYFYRKMIDAGHSVSKFAQAVNDPYLYQIYNQARASSSAGVSMITDAQTNVNAQKVGESLNGIFSPIRAKGEDYYRAFQMYLFDLHNIDRMSLSQNKEAAMLEATAALNQFDADHPELRTNTEAQLARMTESLDPDVAELAREKMRLLRNVNRADAIKDKPVFSFDVTADISQERARRALQEHPEFEQYRQQVRGYIDNLMQYRVDSGLMTQADVDYLKRLYPNYVPTMRKGGNQAGAGRDRNAVRIGRTVGRAEGGTADLVPLHEALGRQTMKVVREGSKNRFGQRLLDDFIQAGENSKAARYVQEANEYEHDFAPDTLDDMSREQLTKDKTLTVFKDGKLWELTVDDTMFDALKALSPDAAESNAVTRAVRTANNLFKALVTGYNPTFTVRNTVRDLQTAGLYTRDGVAFARNYPKALAEIKNNGQYWQMYKALGGSFSSVFDYNTGTVKEPKGRTAKLMAKVEALNMAMEQAPRLAEFMGVVEKGGTSTENLADALYAAADVTVNFGRSGTLGKVLNANYVPFLNPGIQGFDKMIRRVTETKGGKEWAKFIVRAVTLGIAPALLNSLLYHDDEEWDDLRDSDKDTNYMFKLGNGTWLKIPKGRELSLLGITADRIGDVIRGDDVDLIATINTMGNQVAPANPLTSNIASALFEAQLFDPSSPGRTWYGGDIENQRLQSYAPGQRYDSSTDIFSKAVGGALGISPKKLNYVLDQYSGVVGDFLLPLLTPQAERGMFSKAFTVDVVTSNRLNGDFYDEADALTYAKNDGDETAAVVSRFWSKQQSACSDLYKQIREAEASDLSDREKRQKTRELKALVNGIQKNAMAVEDTYREAVERNLRKGMNADDAYRAANKDCFGAEYALQVYNKDVYEKAKNAKSNGVSYDDYYTYYFATRGFEKTDDTSVTTQKFDWLQRSGMDLTSQAEIYFADMASDKVLETQAELEISDGITAEQFYQYKVASSGMTKKAEKMQAINSLDLTSAQKDAIYYAEGWAQSTIGEAPWRGGDGGNYSGRSSSSNRYLSYLAEKNGYTLQEAAPSTPRYSSYLQYLATKDGISLAPEDTNSGLQSKYLREFASRWGG